MSMTIKLSIPNISCHHCTNSIVRETKDLAGVEDVQADVESKTATFVLSSESDLALVRETLAEIGYPAAN